MSSSHEQIIHRFLLETFRRWKSAKYNYKIDWTPSRCCRCKLPLFSENFTLCLDCDQWEEEEQSKQRCVICGDDADGGPIPIVCSRSCLRSWNRD